MCIRTCDEPSWCPRAGIRPTVRGSGLASLVPLVVMSRHPGQANGLLGLVGPAAQPWRAHEPIRWEVSFTPHPGNERCSPTCTSPESTAAGCTHEPPGTPAQGDQTPDPGRGDLPHPGLTDADGGDAPRRAGRRVAGDRPAVLQPGIDGEGRCLEGGDDPKALLAQIA